MAGPGNINSTSPSERTERGEETKRSDWTRNVQFVATGSNQGTPRLDARSDASGATSLHERSISTSGTEPGNAAVALGLMKRVYENLDIATVLPRGLNDTTAYKDAETLVNAVSEQLESYISEGGTDIPVKNRKKIQQQLDSMKSLVATKSKFQRAMLTASALLPFAPPLYTAVRLIPSGGALYATTQIAHYIKTGVQVGVLANDEKAGVKEYAENFKYRQLISLTFSLAFLKAAMTEEPTDRQPDSAFAGAVGAGVFVMSMVVFNPSLVTKMLDKASQCFGSEKPQEPEARTSTRIDTISQAAEVQIDAAIVKLSELSADPEKVLGNLANEKMSAVKSLLLQIKGELAVSNEGPAAAGEVVVLSGDAKATKVAIATVGALASILVAVANLSAGNFAGFTDFALDGVLGVGELYKKASDDSVNVQGQKALFTDLQGLTLLLVIPYMVDWLAGEPGAEAGDVFLSLLVLMAVANLTIPGPIGEAVGSLIQRGVEKCTGKEGVNAEEFVDVFREGDDAAEAGDIVDLDGLRGADRTFRPGESIDLDDLRGSVSTLSRDDSVDLDDLARAPVPTE